MSIEEQEVANREAVKKKHTEAHKYHEILLRRRELLSRDLKVLVAFAEHFDLSVNVRENLGALGFVDQHGLIVSISEQPF